MQLVGFQFPSRALLHQWGKEDSPNCPSCPERKSLGHIQSSCKVLEKPRIVAHHMVWREILLQLLGHSGDEGNEQKWAIPSALSAEQHKELTVRQILHSQGSAPPMGHWRVRFSSSSPNTQLQPSRMPVISRMTRTPLFLRWNLIVKQTSSLDCAFPPIR